MNKWTCLSSESSALVHKLHILLMDIMRNEVINLYFQCLSRSTAVEIVNSSKVLQAETRMLLDGKLLVQLCSFIHIFSLLSSLFPSPILLPSTVCLCEAIQAVTSHISVSAVYLLPLLGFTIACWAEERL